MSNPPAVRFSVIGLNHDHIYHQVDVLLGAGGALVSFFAIEDDLAMSFVERYPQAARTDRMQQILDDDSIQVVVSASIPDERALVGVQVMRHGKDFLSDKPGFTSLDQVAAARRAHEETGRLYYVSFGRLTSKAMRRAGELVQAGAIGRPLQIVALGPHRLNTPGRPSWFFQRERYGGIITDLGSHPVDQFLFFTASTSAEVVSAQIANYNHPDYPELEDFGDVVLRGDGGCTGYLRVDWFTPDGIATFGDQRLVVLGTDGYLEVRGTCDLAGRPGGGHLFLVDHKDVHYIDCTDVEVAFGRQMLNDVHDRTQTVMSQEHCFQVSELALRAQNAAQRVRT